MRHSSLDLTMNVYTDPSLLDVAGALDVLPSPLLRMQGGMADGMAVGAQRACRLRPPVLGWHPATAARNRATSRAPKRLILLNRYSVVFDVHNVRNTQLPVRLDTPPARCYTPPPS